ncbi:unnamed protein product, partial [Rotaria sp. Silwood1]
MEINYDCSYSIFTRHIPSYIVSPEPNEWGTCLCMKCLNPQIKSDRINQLKNKYPAFNCLSSLMTNDLTSIIDDKKKVEEILKELDFLKAEPFTINDVEWIKKSEELSDLQQYMELVRLQFKSAKLIRQLALTSDSVATIQLDWSENYHLKQTRQERSAYYYEQQISIAAGYVWQQNNCFSFGCLSDETNHQSESTWAAIHDLLDELLNEKSTKPITELNIISDSPSSQSIYIYAMAE